MRKELGKIKDIYFGYGGYDDAMIGIHFALGNNSSGVCDWWGTWAGNFTGIARSWTDKDRIEILGKIVLDINNLLTQAKVTKLSELKNIPIEITYDDNKLKSWRILTEVI